MKVLLSIKPEFAFKIFNGSKKYEYRRILFKHPGIKTIIVYASNPVKKVIGEFDIENILHEEPEMLWHKTGDHSGISREKFFDYFTDARKGYAIAVKSTHMYDDPLPLDNFMLSVPPQSFAYIH
jgi:predicted transcriptional regulator